jgi:hypothetical protein
MSSFAVMKMSPDHNGKSCWSAVLCTCQVREEQELIHEAKRIAEEKYRRDKELQARQEEEDRRRKKEAFARYPEK